MSKSNGHAPKLRIAVMGVTGSGKSTFISIASGLSGESTAKVGHQLHSCTADVAAFDFTYSGYDITLIDTPGFNDTVRSETEVLKAIADWLDVTYRNPPHLKLTGIIYLQSIMDPRMYGSSLRNLKMFKDLCGENPLKNVIVATTRWGLAAKAGEGELCLEREDQLRTDAQFWAPMIKRGARMSRFQDTRESALQLLLSLANQQPVVLQIQKELVDEDKNLIDTAAGTTVNEEAVRLEQKYKDELAQIQKEMDEALAARDLEVQEALKESQEGFEKKLEKVRAEQDMLRYERRNESRRMQSELDQLRAERDAQQKENERQRKAYEAQIVEKLGAQKLEYDEAIARLKANENKLRREQREVLEQKIQEQSKKPKKERTVIKLLLSLLPVLGSVAFGLLGLPSPFSMM
ncbi:hypothetical protein H2203_003838 [Taxawa tesnikishii (nom. ined.)]|nr:hypothetical protein H2203_003838 [Dothideales sp. JES 119]